MRTLLLSAILLACCFSACFASPLRKSNRISHGGANDQCSNYTTCYSCVQQASCGFCLSSGQCFSGSSAGPNGTSNSTCQWSWTSSQCPSGTPFIDHASPTTVHIQVPTTIYVYGNYLNSVSSVQVCGYSVTDLHYISSTGALTFITPTNLPSGTCRIVAFSSTTQSNNNVTLAVTADSCTSAYSSCSSCTSSSGCGYCGSYNGLCASGNQTGPAGFGCSQWAWSSSGCSSLGPSISSLSPSYVTELSGSSISIYGSNFVSTPYVYICGYSADRVYYYDSTSLSVTLPDSVSSGSCYVRVVNPGGQSATSPTMLTVSSASVYISSISPSSGSASGGTYLSIYGSGFRSGASVTVCGWTCYSVYVSDHSTISCTTPYIGDSEYCDVKVTNPNGRSATDYSAFYTYREFYAGPIVGICVGGFAFIVFFVVLIIIIQQRQRRLRLARLNANTAAAVAATVPSGVAYQAMPAQAVTWATAQGAVQQPMYVAQQQPGGPVVYYQLPPGATMAPGAAPAGAMMMPSGAVTTMATAAAPAPTTATQQPQASAPVSMYYPAMAQPQPQASFVSNTAMAPGAPYAGMPGAAL